jgi:hypothetical protein
MMQPVKGCYIGKVTYARRRETVIPPNNGARALARAARRRSKNILADFLKAVLPGLAEEEFEELTIVDPHLKREFSGDKLEILDVKLRTAAGKSIDIEIQISDLPEMRSRIQGALQQGLEKGRQEGRAEGEARVTRKIILEMNKSGMGVKDIAAITHLSEWEVGGILKQGSE